MAPVGSEAAATAGAAAPTAPPAAPPSTAARTGSAKPTEKEYVSVKSDVPSTSDALILEFARPVWPPAFRRQYNKETSAARAPNQNRRRGAIAEVA